MPLKSNSQEFYKATRNEILSACGDEINLLKDAYLEKRVGIAFKTTKRQYVEYLIACLVGTSLGIKISPPLNVDALWHLHVMETKSYRKLERIVVAKFKHWMGDTSIENHIDHSMVENREGGAEKLNTRDYSAPWHLVFSSGLPEMILKRYFYGFQVYFC